MVAMEHDGPLRITHVAESLQQHGVARLVVDLALSQCRAGHRVQVISLRPGAEGAHALRRGRVGWVATDAAGLRRCLLDEPADVVHTHDPTPHLHTVRALSGLGPQALVLTHHGVFGDEGDPRDAWTAPALPWARCIVAVSAHAAARLRGLPGVDAARLAIVPNGIDLQQFAAVDRRAARQRLGLTDDTKVIGSVGRLSHAKDHALLIRAFAEVRRRHGSARLVIVGDGELRPQLLRQAVLLGLGGDVLLTGARQDVAQVLPAFDVFALASRAEGYPLALLEAAATGLPLVSTDAGGCGEIVRDGVTGRLVPVGDGTALADALDDVLCDDPARRALGAAARAWAAEHACRERMQQAYMTIYRRVLQYPEPSPAGVQMQG